jgi:hypothetical protein
VANYGSATKVEFSRWLGLVDEDDPTNLPMGCAALAQNCRFSLTEVETRFGIQTAIQGLNQSAITGLLGSAYTPESATQSYFQAILLYDYLGTLQIENPTGGGTTTGISSPLVTLPAKSHMIGTQAYNRDWLAFSNLQTPTSFCSVYDLYTKNLWPYGMKPVGFGWYAGAQVLVGECVTPSILLDGVTVENGNGHLYICTQAGTLGANQPVWPLTEGGTVNDGGAVWKEQTPVLANCIAPPPAPSLSLAGSGTIATAKDVYIAISLLNEQGESLPSLTSVITTIAGSSSVLVQIPTLASLPGWERGLPPQYIPNGANVYVSIVAHGAAAPALSSYNLFVSGVALGSMVLVTSSGLGAGTQYPGGSDSVTLNLGPSDSNTVYSGGISGFPSVAVISGTTISLYVDASVIGTLGAGGAIEWDISGDSGATWTSLYGVGGTHVVFGPALLTFGLPGGVTNIDTVQLRIKATGTTGPGAHLAVSGDITSCYITIPTVPLAPSLGNTARITGGLIPTPIVEPIITRASGTGSFSAGRDVYILQTYENAIGETLPGPANSIIDTQLNDAVVVTTEFLEGYAITAINLYECDVPTGTTFDGNDFPPFANFTKIGSYGNGVVVTVTGPASGSPPPTVNTTGSAGNIARDTLQGGPNSTQGYRWAVVAYQDFVGSISGIRSSAAFKYVVDENGWELGVFNLPTGPAYIQNVVVGFAVADGLDVGPFAYSPMTLVSDGIQITTTVFANGTSSATVNFSDEYLTGLLADSQTNITDRLRVIQPQQCVDIYYSPSVDRIFQTGVPGFYSGHWVSLAADPESYYGDTSGVTVGTSDGERAICVREYKGTLYSLRERSGFELNPATADPATWTPTQRWTKMGPCGPRAVDVCGKFLIFVHSSGIYKYESDYPELVSKELPRWWNTINWKAQQAIWCAIDVEQHEVRMGFPVGGSTIPNVVLTLNYEEGWNNPLLFSRYSGKEITIEQCRKYSVDNLQGYVGGRFYRTISNQPDPMGEGPVNTTQEVERQFISQFLISSSGPDGTVQAVSPGVYNDNGSGIDCQYESVAAQQMMTLCKLQGINMNARGNGQLFVSFIAGAKRITDWNPAEPTPPWLVPLRPFDLEINPTKGLSRNTPSRLSERWRARYTNGAIPDAWFSVKYACVFVSPMFQARTAGENK